MKKKRVMTCLVAGVCILAVSVTAAFGSVNGYANYKTAVKTLALETDNVSAKGTFHFSYDGKDVLGGDVEYAKDGANQSAHIVIRENGTVVNEEFNTTLDDVTTFFSADSEYYNTYDTVRDEETHGLLGFSNDDEFSKRLITFFEMGVDTVMGDLKNNVVEVGSQNGDYTYQLDISNSQVPALVNAGLSLIAYGVSESMTNCSYVDYEDYNHTAFAYYESQTGKTLSNEFKENYVNGTGDESWYADNEELDSFYEVMDGMWNHYYDILKQKGDTGILYVRRDGSYTYYVDQYAYREAVGVTDVDDFEQYIGKDLSLQNVHFTFSLNKAGQLTVNACEATFDTTDKNGGHHSLVIQVDATLGDYGTTEVQPLDVGDRVSYDDFLEENNL